MAYSVALVLDPDFGSRLKDLSTRLHTWVVESPQNASVTHEVWNALPKGKNGIESGVTIFKPFGKTREDWCIAVIDALDLHHNDHSHDPGYSVLEVIGVAASEAIRDEFSEFGFEFFRDTDDGFIAQKDGAAA